MSLRDIRSMSRQELDQLNEEARRWRLESASLVEVREICQPTADQDARWKQR